MKFIKSAVLAFGMLLFAQARGASPRATAGAGGCTRRSPISRPIGAGLVIIGAAWASAGWPRRPSRAWPAQPEIAGNIQTAMIIAAALSKA